MIPTSVKEVNALGWDYIDIIIFSGDAFVDHPSFGTAVIARYLQKAGYRVAVVPQPNWRDDLRDFRKLGAPRLYFGVNAGAMDSMVNHYTAAKRLRSDDAYTPGGKAGQRPDYAVTVYTKILKDIYPEIPVVIGGIEASLRRLTHYDYWKDDLMPSVLVTSGADWLCYGMGERPMLELTKAIESGRNLSDIRKIPQLAFFMTGKVVPDVGFKWDYSLDYNGLRNWKAGEWHHVVLTWDSGIGVKSLTIDGRLVKTSRTRHFPSAIAAIMARWHFFT